MHFVLPGQPVPLDCGSTPRREHFRWADGGHGGGCRERRPFESHHVRHDWPCCGAHCVDLLLLDLVLLLHMLCRTVLILRRRLHGRRWAERRVSESEGSSRQEPQAIHSDAQADIGTGEEFHRLEQIADGHDEHPNQFRRDPPCALWAVLHGSLPGHDEQWGLPLHLPELWGRERVHRRRCVQGTRLGDPGGISLLLGGQVCN
mmetsp:Transcript_125124/g.359291  ORF Transcript_125124/g.359291 Transcript_125124/m.359291 type:complete len:203 (+) Transcript_125124:214-822(+)